MSLRFVVGLALAAVTGLAVAAVPAQAAPTTGCGVPATAGPTQERTIVTAGTTRQYWLHLPAGYDPRRPTPVIMAFHGHGKSGPYMERLTGFSDLPVIAVYPQGRTGTDGQRSWQGAWYARPGVDDVRFVSDLLDALQASLCVDASRVFVAGKSNGAGLANLVACRLGPRIAAAGLMAGAYYPEARSCAGAVPVPVVELHGTADATARYPGRGGDHPLPAVLDFLAEWALRNGCAAAPVAKQAQDTVTKYVWTGCAADLVHYRITGLEHVWASTEPNQESDRPSVMNATWAMWNFFRQHPR